MNAAVAPDAPRVGFCGIGKMGEPMAWRLLAAGHALRVWNRSPALEGRIGSEIMLVAQTGRKRQTERKGILTETYPSVFVVDLDPDENSFERVSYSYSDVLTRTVEIEFIGQAV